MCQERRTFAPLNFKAMNVKKHSMGEWVLATRPWSFPASAMPVMVTMVWLWSRGVEVCWWLGVLALLNIVLVHAAGNVWSDIADYRRGVDAEDTFGTRLLVDEQFSPDEFRRLSLVLNVAAVVLGLAMVGLTGWPLLVIGVAGLLLSLCYPGLKYAALGDVVIILCYALLPMLGTSYVVSGEIRPCLVERQSCVFLQDEHAHCRIRSPVDELVSDMVSFDYLFVVVSLHT